MDLIGIDGVHVPDSENIYQDVRARVRACVLYR